MPNRKAALAGSGGCRYIERMSPALESLIVLQERDRKLLELRNDLDRIPREEQRAGEHLGDDRREVEEATDALRHCEMDIKTVEIDIGTRRTTIERLHKQQFETKKNEEYQALGHEVARYKEQVDELETRELELMEVRDACRARLDKGKKALAKTQAFVDDELAQLAERRANIEKEIADLTLERETLAEAVPDSVLSLYSRLLESKGGMALSHVTADGQCDGCHMKLVAATLIKARSGQEVVQCENCARILLPEE